MACVSAGARVLQVVGRRGGEVQGVVEFAIGQQFGITGDVDAGEFETEAAVESGPKWFGLAVTHRESLSGGQEMSENPEKPGIFAQVLCQNQGFIWEIRGQLLLAKKNSRVVH